MQLVPYRVENLHGEDIDSLDAAKFHSAAVSREGLLFTWGFGRGGRLGEHSSAPATESLPKMTPLGLGKVPIMQMLSRAPRFIPLSTVYHVMAQEPLFCNSHTFGDLVSGHKSSFV